MDSTLRICSFFHLVSFVGGFSLIFQILQRKKERRRRRNWNKYSLRLLAQIQVYEPQC